MERVPLSLTLSASLALLLLLASGWAAMLSRWAGSPWQVFWGMVLTWVPMGFLLFWWQIRRPMAVLRALSDSLLGFTERDFSLRLAPVKQAELGAIADQLNRLGDVLRTEHNDRYQKEMLLDSVLQSAPMAILLCENDGRVLLSNRLAREWFGAGRKLDGEKLVDVLERSRPWVKQLLSAEHDSLLTVEESAEPETYHVSRRYFQLNLRQHTLYMITHLTRELSRQEVEVWKKVIRVISHELNNSLAPISSMTHSARMILNQPEQVHRLGRVFDTIEERTSHLSRFLDGYARFARLPRPRKENVAWEAFLTGLEGLTPFRREGELPEVPGCFDPAQLQQVMLNLLKNAAESGSALDDITVQLKPHLDGVTVSVCDRGPGMSEEVLRNALLPFYSTKQQGTGLGLALCREIVEAHGGNLKLELREGGGLVVSFWLPECKA